MRDSDVILTLTASEPMDPEVLERHMFEVQDAVEEHAADVALGPVTAVNLRKSAIELAFTTRSDSHTDVQDKIRQVMSAIETYTDVHVGPVDAHVRQASREADHAALTAC